VKRLPLSVRVAAAVAVALVGLPLLALAWRAPWSTITDLATDATARQAIGLSLWTSLAAALLALLLGVPLASALARSHGAWATVARAVVMVPMVLPPVVGGVALLATFGRRGLIGQWLEEWWGWSLSFTTTAVVLAQLFVALPFLVISVEGAMRSHSFALQATGATLGASPWQQWWRITLPAARPGILAGLALAWARALGEFGATITFAGAFPGRTATVPVAVYEQLQTNPGQAIMLSVFMMAVSVAMLAVLRNRWLAGFTPSRQASKPSR